MMVPHTRKTYCHKLRIIAGLILFIFIMPVLAVSAENGTVISQGGTIFIGEEGLNVTHALNQAYYGSTGSGSGPGGIGTPAQNNSFPRLTRIGWWASAASLYYSSPSKVIDLGVNRRYAGMTVAPADFVGYTGNWYLLDATGTQPVGSSGATSMVFSVQDPSLDIKIWDYNQNFDMTGRSVPQGEMLGFRIDTNMYPAADGRYRNNIIDDSAVGIRAPVVLYADPGTNVMIDTTGTWLNETITIPDPVMPCCREITLFNMAYTNVTNFGAWMTWNEGHAGCRNWINGPMYYNASTRSFVRFNSLGIGPSGPDLTPVSWDQITRENRNYCSQSKTVAATDGFIDIKIKDESNAQLISLYNASESDIVSVPGPYTVMKNFIDTQPFFWGSGAPSPVHLTPGGLPYDGHAWNTGARDGFGQYAYPVGTYTVCAESRLNRMKSNYKQGGADYTGKTVSQCYTITLVTDTVKIEANKDAVVRSRSFSVTVTGRPGTEYYLWVTGTRNMTGGPNNQPPMIVRNQEKVFMDPYNPTDLSYPVGQYQYESGAGRKIRSDVAVSRWTGNGTRCYAKIQTSTSGVRTIEFLTTNWTRVQEYTIRVEQQFPIGSAYNTGTYKSDETSVQVGKGSVTIATTGDPSYYPGDVVTFHGTNTETYRTYLFITGPGLRPNGSQMQSPDPRLAAVTSNNQSTFLSTDVSGDNTWSASWRTAVVHINPGTYTVWAVSQPFDRPATLQSGAAYGKFSITIRSLAPVTDFSASPRSGTAPLTVRFTDNSTQSPISWKWMFGDGSAENATTRDPVHTYTKAGTYNVSLKSANLFGNNTAIKRGYITVSAAPPSVTSVKPAAGRWGTTVMVTDLIGTGFEPGADVIITKSGSTPIRADNISVKSPTNITCSFTIPVYTAIGPWNVRVNNTDGKSGTKVKGFLVRTPSPPSVTGITPAYGAPGTTVQVSYLSGTGFALDPKPAVQLIRNTETINASNISVINPDRITCTFRIPATATIGSWTVRIRNADGQSGVKTGAFQVSAPPGVTAVSPDNGIIGTTVMALNVSGTGFAEGARVSFTKSGNPLFMATNVSVISPQLITCSVAIPADAGIGFWKVLVENTDGSGSKANAFLVKTPAPPVVTGITPDSGIRGTTVRITNLSGTGFVSGQKPVVQLFSGSETITATNVTVVSPESLTCTFGISPYAVTGPWNVRVRNPDLQYGVKYGAFTIES